MNEIKIMEIAVLRSGKRGNEIKLMCGTTRAEARASLYRGTTGKNYYPIFKDTLPLTKEEGKGIVRYIKEELVALGFEKLNNSTFDTANLSKDSIKEIFALVISEALKNL